MVCAQKRRTTSEDANRNVFFLESSDKIRYLWIDPWFFCAGLNLLEAVFSVPEQGELWRFPFC